ncbi:peptidoglycan-binding domain-containing protein [Flavimaricola marinus]|uniref:Putative peptidoglycan binding domain protein n=1 Tax=Flavimaricola marinus TaxID=1819565 RepID=A0A238LJN5_9RHOB|nr:peptidoglycan-binding domain-containing protein [Flavimaricola marinus]SMY09889.1 Putative peptidoglycan binding domain protein [Flavimaricola marinus]
MSRANFYMSALSGLALAACAAQPSAVPEMVPAFMAAQIESDSDGRCFGRDITPAVIETVTAQVLDAPATIAEDGSVISPAFYRSEIRQQITRERQEVAFETLCPPAYTVEFVQTLQRALKARGYYTGDVHGHLDTMTGRAVQEFQRDDGPDSPLLWIATARELGIVELSPEQIDLLNTM